MADYYQLVTKAVAGLDPEAPSESRRALYERARAALLAEMRTINPFEELKQMLMQKKEYEAMVSRVRKHYGPSVEIGGFNSYDIIQLQKRDAQAEQDQANERERRPISEAWDSPAQDTRASP